MLSKLGVGVAAAALMMATSTVWGKEHSKVWIDPATRTLRDT